MKETARITSTPPTRMWRRLPASNSAVRLPARRIGAGGDGSSVPKSLMASAGSAVMVFSSPECLLSADPAADDAFDQQGGDDDRADRRALPEGRHADQVQAVPDHDHDQH